jgi:hypothetical protein
MVQWEVRSYDLLRHLERRFDGEMPDDLRRAALAGGEAALLSASRQANSRCIDRLAMSAVHAAASRRCQDGEAALWRHEGLAWRREAGDSA